MECLNCGMFITHEQARCPKCDNLIAAQHDGSTVTIDIAHQGETVRQAIDKLHDSIDATKSGTAQNLRVIVGGGLIRDEVFGMLIALEHSKTIINYRQESPNTGAILIRLKA